jgi:hypothetical protein
MTLVRRFPKSPARGAPMPLRLLFLLLLLLVPLLSPAPAVGQQTPPPVDVIGAVIDARTGERISSAVVRFPGADRYTLTRDDGFFTLRNVRPGEHEVIVHRLGYQEQTFLIQVAAGHRHLFELEPAPIVLDGVEVTVGPNPAHRILDRAARLRALPVVGTPVFWSSWDREAIEKAGFDEPMAFLTQGPPRIIIRPCVGLGLPADRLCVSPPFGGMRMLAEEDSIMRAGRLARGAGRMLPVYLDDRYLGPLEELDSFPMDLIHRVEAYGYRGESGLRFYTEGYLRLVAEGLVQPGVGGAPTELYEDLVRERARLGLPPPGMPGGPPRP